MTIAVAREFALTGEPAGGYTLLLRGLRGAEAAFEQGILWSGELSRLYRRAIEEYIARHGVPIPLREATPPVARSEGKITEELRRHCVGLRNRGDALRQKAEALHRKSVTLLGKSKAMRDQGAQLCSWAKDAPNAPGHHSPAPA